MTKNKCFVCETNLTEENSSDEHILINALGGHIHSKKLLCKKCNSVFGTTSDEELAKEMRFFASYLDVPRQRGDNQTVRTLDERYDMMPGGIPILRSPVVKKTKLKKGFVFEVEARDESELKWIVEKLAQKYPDIDVEKIIQSKEEKIDATKSLKITAEFHAKKIFPSIIKSAVEYFLLCGGKDYYIKHLVPYIKGEANSCDCCMFFYPQSPFYDTVIGNMYHVLYVKGNAAEHLLYGYVSYFGVIQCVVLLSDCYVGKDIEEGYTYEVMTSELSKTFPQYSLSKEQIEEILQTPYDINCYRIQDRVRYYIMNADLIKLQRSIMPELQEFCNEQRLKEQNGEIDLHEAGSAIAAKYIKLISPWLLKYMNRRQEQV